MDALPKGLSADVNVHENGLWLTSDARISIGDGDSSDFGRTCNHAWEGIGSFSLALDESFEN
jgi:hypothetical protein